MYFLFSFILFLSPAIFASGWQEVNNGGEGLLCHDSTSMNQLYAIERAETIMHFQYKEKITDLRHLPDLDIAKSLLARLPKVADKTQIMALKLVNTFYAESTLVDDTDIPLSNDGGTYQGIPQHCERVQIAIQRRHSFPVYLLNKSYWPFMTPLERGIIITHEVLYRIALNSGTPASSQEVRLVIVLLIADLFPNLSAEAAKGYLDDAFLLSH